MKGHGIILWSVALMILAALCLFATAGPIKGLVDIGTGQEVPDADLRYLKQPTNTPPGSGYVVQSTDATGTNTEWVAAGGCQEHSVTSDYSFAAASSVNFSATGMVCRVPDIMRGRIYVPNINNDPFSAVVELTWYASSNRLGYEAIWRANMRVVQVTLTADAAAGTNVVTVADSSDFTVGDLVYLMGTNPEFVRIEQIAANDLTLETPTLNAHSTGDGASRAAEFGGYFLEDDTYTGTLWGRAKFSSAQTVDMATWVQYKK